MNKLIPLLEQVTESPFRFFQNCQVVFICIGGFYLCSKLTSPKSLTEKLTVPRSQSKGKSLVRLMIFIL